MKDWDFVTTRRPDKIISISQTVAKRCLKYYHRQSEIVYPPFEEKYWEDIKSKIKNQKSKPQLKTQSYFLVVSRLEKYKKVDLVVKSINRLDINLVVVGEGGGGREIKKYCRQKHYFFVKTI